MEIDLEYDQKFDEMKKYIPFLESMIKRLESTHNGNNNPRKAQLDKIRSLRDLLLDKKKRMKMENLLKCEQVLINLYAKVEQRDSMMECKKSEKEPEQKDKSDLNVARNKLKSVVTRLNDPETLPEIARATNKEVHCTLGSKEPALFQRRPNKCSPPRETTSSSKNDDLLLSKRHYTRVLMSPERKMNEWSPNKTDKPLISRRSPRKSPRRHSPSYKKERKKSFKQRSKSRQETEDLNITLKVPQASLNSLNTDDILSRIINCSDNDVDINTLRGLRSQILGELKQTGAQDDISELILKSYKNKQKQSDKNAEIEEGEISDSESETNENIYGSLVVVNKDIGSTSSSKTSTDNHQPRKIQICLVINSEKEEVKGTEQKPNTSIDATEFESYSDKKAIDKKRTTPEKTEDKNKQEKLKPEIAESKINSGKEESINCEEKRKNESPKEASEIKHKTADKNKDDNNKGTSEKTAEASNEKSQTQSKHSQDGFKPNFYQPLTEEKSKSIESQVETNDAKPENDNVAKILEMAKNVTQVKKSASKVVKKDVVSEIDILQALKKEILGESVTAPASSDEVTPPLHQPKLIKVSSAKEISSKKRISIENYKQKSAQPKKQPVFNIEKKSSTTKEDNSRKQSLKLTEKECERFNLPPTIPSDDSSDDEKSSILSLDDIYNNIRDPTPKSPDHDDFADTGIKPPVIIPSDPIKNIALSAKADIDMRTMTGPTIAYSSPNKNKTPLLKSNEIVVDPLSSKNGNGSIKKSVPETRSRTDSLKCVTNGSPSPYSQNSDRPPISGVNYPIVTPTLSPSTASALISMNMPSIAANIGLGATSIMSPILTTGMALTLNPNMVPNLNPNMTPNRTAPGLPLMNPIMTPIITPNARSYEMTPRPNFDNDDFTTQKHVYAPTFGPFDTRDYAENDVQNTKTSRWENNENWEDRDPRNTSRREMDYQRNKNDRFSRDSFNVRDSPQTRMDCPPTPKPPFGRMEAPLTPVPSFGRSDCPRTPSHPFGRSESNVSTPTNVFGRSDYRHNTSIPNQNFKRSFDPRLNRSSEYDNHQGRNEERNLYYNDGRSADNPYKYRKGQGKFFDKNDRQRRENMLRREAGVGESSKDFNTDEPYKNEYYNKDNRYSSDKPKGYDEFDKRRNQRARSIGRGNPSEERFSSPIDKRGARISQRDSSTEKVISVKSHSGRMFNIDTSLHRTFQDNSSLNMSFDARRQRASSVGRTLREDHIHDDLKKINNKDKLTFDIPNRNKNFRRACSVGRELKYCNESKNLIDIKADLRSYKFDSYEKKIRDKNNQSKVPTNVQNTKEAKNYQDPRNKTRHSDSKVNKFDDSSKYSPKKNFRDPRVRRDIKEDIRNDKFNEKDRNRGASGFKNRGIVYSNDNIAKGTILASAAGVKNFKIPKIKRPETKETEIAPIPESIKDDVQSQSENKLNDVDRARIKHTENIEIKPSNTNKEDIPTKSEKKSAAISLSRIRKMENKELTSELTLVDKNSDLVKTKEEMNEKMVKARFQDKKKIKDQSQDDTDSVSSMSDNCDRRLTRSTRKSTLQSKLSNKGLPVRKLRRIKKPLTYDSDDSDSQNSSMNNESDMKKDSNEDISSKTTEIAQDISDVKDEKSDPLTAQLDNEKHTINEKLELKPVFNINNEVRIEHQEGLSLDSISFAGDDEYFNENDQLDNPPGFVLDNINDLIADLDHHIEAPKLNDFNDKFINNIVGSISSSDSPIPIEVNENDFAPDLMVSDKLNLNQIEDIGKIANQTSENKLENKNNEDILHEKVYKNVTDSVSGCKTAALLKESLTTKTATSNIQSHSSEVQETAQNVNNDAIVSTTANDGKVEEVAKKLEPTSSNANMICDSFVPDSTMNPNEANVHKDLRSDPDSTINEVTSEMNSDITSTHSSADTLSKDQSVASSSSGDALPRLDSLSKLLSILEDKNKIKELLSYLGNDSSENEKIKKKLEKLSEIVSDDEGETKVSNKSVENTTDDKNRPVVCGDQIMTDDKDKSSLQTIDEKKSDNKNSTSEYSEKDSDECHKVIEEQKSEVKDKKRDKEIDEGSTKSVGTVQAITEQQSSNEETDKNGTGEILKNQKDIEKTSLDHESLQKPNENNSDGSIIKDIEKSIDQMVEVTKQKETIEATTPLPARKIVKKAKTTKRGRGKIAKKKLALNKEKRVTRSDAVAQSPAPVTRKKPSRELLALKLTDDILNATGIRMCRLAKMVDEKNPKTNEKDVQVSEAEPVVLLEKIKGKDTPEDTVSPTEKPNNKKPTKTKSKASVAAPVEANEKPKYKPGPKSKTKKSETDPYSFENDSIAESTNTNNSKDRNSDSESDSIDSVKSVDSSELLVELKKKGKRRRLRWQLGVIRTKNVRKKKSKQEEEEPKLKQKPETNEVDQKTNKNQKPETNDVDQKTTYKIPDPNCFTDKSYCFYRNVDCYECRLCEYKGPEIVLHYKKHHPHSEIPLSRLREATAQEAIKQCENMNLHAVSKIHTKKYVCRFCFAEFHKTSALETFFWHVVSVHTGEYKHICSECINVTRCPFHLDIPPPPKNPQGQLIGYICGRCHFTQVSLENLKTHVIVRHDDEQTEVYSINLSEIPKNVLQSLLAGEEQIEKPRVLRSTRSNQSFTESSDDRSDITGSTDRISASTPAIEESLPKENVPKPRSKKNIQPKFVFENDDMSDTSSYSKNDEIIKTGIKLERDEDSQDSKYDDVTEPEASIEEAVEGQPDEAAAPTDVLDYPHFKVKYSDTGSKEYVCCINRDSHYQTSLLISFKKHVQLKHSENWDGYCYVCKVIVMSQGVHKFKDCLQHFLDKHMDNFPVFVDDTPAAVTNDTLESVPPSKIETSTSVKDAPSPKPYINVRPISDLISTPEVEQPQEESTLPKIQSVVSLGPADRNETQQKNEKVYKFEEAQQEVMARKNRVVLEAMLIPEKLIQVFKCAGRFCSYTTDNAEEALVHASTHKRFGGDNSLTCAYCNFDAMDNAIDLVMHVFKTYSHCPYACSRCFYRAASSQLVYAHIKRIHTDVDPDKVPVLSPETPAEENPQKDNILSRDEAVMYYSCGNRDPETGGRCQFKSFVLTKFREHLQLKHTNDKEFPCTICNIPTPSLKELIRHLKCHGLRIYQCCRCLFGGDNENELIAHASEMHPFRPPKAYLRIITSKGPNSEVRVLPLAVLSKTTVQTTVVISSSVKENPVKQAERSIDLEKLIGHTTSMVGSMAATTSAVASTSQANNTLTDSQIDVESQATVSDSDVTNAPVSTPAQPQTVQNPAANVQVSIKREPEPVPEVEPVLEPEPLPEPVLQPERLPVPAVPEPLAVSEPIAEPVSDPLLLTLNEMNTQEKAASPDSDVVCLDSDEDSSQVIDLSADDNSDSCLVKTSKEAPVPDVKIPRVRLFKCSKCSAMNTTEAMFRRHILSCFSKVGEQIKCAHCPHVAAYGDFFKHTLTHLDAVKFFCTKCDFVYGSKMGLTKHLKRAHLDPPKSPEPATADPERRERPKRKLSSGETTKAQEPAPKLKKYGPQDVDRLPINPILDELVYCSICGFSTKVRLNMARHLQQHAEQQPAPRTAPVNPVPHLDTNEMHFDRMVNLASSSIAIRNERAKDGPAVVEHLSPEAAASYPKYVPSRHRFTCGAKDCAYISVNESMFKFHWETLHRGALDYHCVHCPPHQHLDTTKPLTAARIIAHLKMHDAKLYACSSCKFYHHTRKMVEKHLNETHAGKVVVVRVGGASPPPVVPAPPPATAAPTMDLKPWQCGLCKFKSMLRPEVMEHCRTTHQSKMQFKCGYCGFRASNIDYISQHQSKQHAGKKEEVFYYYYREGSIPDEDGTPRWQKQSQKNEPEIKTEVDPPTQTPKPPSPVPKPPVVNLDIVKKEVVELETLVDENTEDLCKSYGQFCEPNGLKYKCPLCKTVTEDAKETMQSHLYEELQYRKWGCAICSYKAFHKPGLELHVQQEHASNRTGAKEPVELQVDARIETWVAKLLEHQTATIEKNKENLAKQKAEILRPAPGTRAVEKTAEPPKTVESANKANASMAELEELFGPFGVPNNLNYSCPKCGACCRTEALMQEHLEGELNKIRWLCSICNGTFQTYHEAQFHCRSVHQGQSARPVEATRDVALRAAWVASVIRVQKLSMNYVPATEQTQPEPSPQPEQDNSLLVVRYEKNVPTPEELMRLKTSDENNMATPDATPANVQERSDRPTSPESFPCPHCPYNLYSKKVLENHILKHFNLKPFQCPYCPYTNNSSPMVWHIKTNHPNSVIKIEPTVVPLGDPNVVCLTCEQIMTESAQKDHRHDNVKPDFGTKGAVVYKCCVCLTLYPTVSTLKAHHSQAHGQLPLNYSFYKLHNENRVLMCKKCKERFNCLAQYRSHCQTAHKALSSDDPDAVIQIDDDETTGKRKATERTTPPPRKVAKKSTTKLPSMVARKSTTKLPFDGARETDGYSYYGTQPSMDDLRNVTTVVPVFNQMVKFSIEKLDEIFKMNPRVLVEDIHKKL